MHLSLQDSTKKRLREEDDGQEGTPSKRRQNDEEENREGMEKETYETRRGRILSELFGYDKIWCEDCVMMPCICLANNIELKIVKERTEELKRSSHPKTTAPRETTTPPVQPTTTSTTFGVENKEGPAAHDW